MEVFHSRFFHAVGITAKVLVMKKLAAYKCVACKYAGSMNHAVR
jgi:hypothetical protein